MSTISREDRLHDSLSQPQHSRCSVNVGNTERILSVVGAIGLIGFAPKRNHLAQLACYVTSLGLLYRGWTGKCHVYNAIGVSTTSACQNTNAVIHSKQGVHVVESMTIQQPVERLYKAWRDFSSLPHYLTHIDAVEILDQQRSRWIIRAPGGNLQWDAVLIEDKPNELISWKTIGDADVNSAGSIRFQSLPALDATQMTVNLRYEAAGAGLGSWIMSFFNNATEQLIREDLRRFKQIQETGEACTIEGQPTGKEH